MYEAILSQIHEENIENSERAHLVLQWLVVSVRPTLSEQLGTVKSALAVACRNENHALFDLLFVRMYGLL
jgi:hypothetical protein